KDTEEQIRRRLDAACREIDEFTQYEHVVVNDQLEAAVARLGAIVLAERTRVRCMRGAANTIVQTFKNRRKDGNADNT
ncbi:guanylate kinase, partial [bacterium AH-315-O15]|nr:guanylate kinase [bacterium AH-315-O15]